MSTTWYPVQVLRHTKKGGVAIVWMETEREATKEWVSDDYEVKELVKWESRNTMGKALASHTSHSSTPRWPLLTDN